MTRRFVRAIACAVCAGACGCLAAGQPTVEEAKQALRMAATFFHSEVASHGGYVWQCSGDLKLRRGEATTDLDTIWVQPPGTPAVGLAFLEAYEAAGEQEYLDPAVDAAHALVQGQLLSGGWYYSISFDAEARRERNYRVDAQQQTWGPIKKPDPDGEGWHVWRRRKYKGNMTMMDDNTTQCAIRLLARVDEALGFEDEDIHEAALYALESIMMAQYPVGAWSHNYDRFPAHTPDVQMYPVIAASYPESWSRTWPKDWTGCYYLNDNITCDGIAALLDAYQLYGDERYLTAAERGGQFLLLAQMPDPQPAWAQQYDSQMHPVWDRKFEPPAITGWESQGVMEALLLLYRHTGDAKYLEPIPRALQYLRSSLVPDGRLARFYELETNRPLYFTKDYKLTYNADETPEHYGFMFDARLDEIEAEYQRLLATDAADLLVEAQPELTEELAAQVQAIIESMDERGAWVEDGRVKGYYDVEQHSGVINSGTFVGNVRTLCEFIAAAP